MTDKNLTYIKGIIDRSGSMAHIADDTAGSWNAFVKDQAAQPGTCMVSLTEFDTSVDVVFDYRLANSAPDYRLMARGSTALLDALGRSIVELGQKLSAMPEGKRPGAVIVVILTDGQENASREYDRARITQMINEQQNSYDWQFIFLGADLQAVKEAQSWGMRANTTVLYDTNNSDAVLASVSANTSSYRGMTAAGAAPSAASESLTFTDDQREELVAEKPKSPKSKTSK